MSDITKGEVASSMIEGIRGTNTEFDDAEKMYEAIKSEIINFKTKHPGCEVHLSSNDASIRLHEGLTFGLESSLVIQRRKDYNLQQKATQNS